MTRHILTYFNIPSLFLLSLVVITLNNGCSKPDTNNEAPSPVPGQTDTVVTTPPDTLVPIDTPGDYIKRLEVDYIQSNPTVHERQSDYTFYYDALNRVIKIGIRNYSPIRFDTGTTLLFYAGNALKPYQIIAPNVQRSIPGDLVVYDTTWFEYDASDRMLKDSSNQLVYNTATTSYIRKPIYRYYSYPSATKTFIRWYGHQEGSAPVALIREDTLDHTLDSQVIKLKTQFYYSEKIRQNYATAGTFKYTSLINPLSKLNISGTVFSLIYTPVRNEVLGNSYHKAVRNSNILPFYLDFYSGKVASSLYLSGYTADGYLISAQSDYFSIEAIPSTGRNTYPSKITVDARTALDDKVEYRYYY
jgi:hypothetical protein